MLSRPAASSDQRSDPDWAALRPRYVAATAADAEDVHAWAGLAAACVGMGDRGEGHRAADRALALDARNLRAVVAKADLLAADGLVREGAMLDRAAVELGAIVSDLPPDVAQGVARASERQRRLVGEAAERLQQALTAAGWDRARSDSRFTHALDIATQSRRPYLAQPRNFYYPELPAIGFHSRESFPWLDAIEAETAAIIEELSAVLADDASFAPYLRVQPHLPNRTEYPLVSSLDDWRTAWLCKDGQLTELAASCPRTMAALDAAPLCRVRGRSPQIMFSQLEAGAHIRPHTGAVNTRLVCHLPLVVPEGCWFRVGGETRRWEVGKAWAFDDTIEHEAGNGSDQTRVVLIFDVWRPELSEEERRLVATLLETVDAYAPSRAEWA